MRNAEWLPGSSPRHVPNYTLEDVACAVETMPQVALFAIQGISYMPSALES